MPQDQSCHPSGVVAVLRARRPLLHSFWHHQGLLVEIFRSMTSWTLWLFWGLPFVGDDFDLILRFLFLSLSLSSSESPSLRLPLIPISMSPFFSLSLSLASLSSMSWASLDVCPPGVWWSVGGFGFLFWCKTIFRSWGSRPFLLLFFSQFLIWSYAQCASIF